MKPLLPISRRPCRMLHDLSPATRRKPPQRPCEHRPKNRIRKTAITAQCHQARTDRRDRHRASGKSRGVSGLRGSDRRGVPAANPDRAGTGPPPRFPLLAPSPGDLDRDRAAADAERDLDSEIVDRLSRYEAALWRQLAQTLFTLQALKRR